MDDTAAKEKRRAVLGAMAVVLAALAVMLVSTVRRHFEQAPGLVIASRRPPMGEISLRTVGDGLWRLSDHQGEVVAINLWATWCGPCREETPMLVRTVREMGPRGFAVVGVSLDDGERERKVKAFAQAYGVPYPMAFPDAMSQMSAGLEGIPTTLLLDRRARVAKTYVGEVSERVLRSDVEDLLGEAGGR